MATTALKIGDIRIKIMTMTGEPSPSLEGKEAKNFLNIEMRQCDEDFLPVGKCSISLHEEDEESYHRKLRIDAVKEGHFVPEESTDYKWNPGYKPDEEETQTKLE